MTSVCAVPECSNTSSKGFRTFTFPKDRNLRSKWVKAIGRNPDWQPSNGARVCEEHFPVEARKTFFLPLGTIPLCINKACTCIAPVGQHLLEHCYAKKVDIGCPKHGPRQLPLRRVAGLMKENCILKNELKERPPAAPSL